MDDREVVEADQPVEPGDPGQQQHLEQREVRGKEPRQPGEARDELGDAVDAREVPAPVPEPHDGRRIAEESASATAATTRRLTMD